jgi:hypothetical protein
VRVHARRGDPELAGDLLGRPTRGDRAQDLSLPIGQGLFHSATVEDVPRKQVPGEKTEEKRCRALAMHL